MAVIAIDLDGVIHDYKKVKWPEFTDPITDAQPMMMKLKRLNHKIIIFSARAYNPVAINEIMDWLIAHKIPYDGITNIKGAFDYIIDDKAVHFDNWADVMKEIK